MLLERNLVKGHWQQFLLFYMKELLKLYNNFFYSFFISLFVFEIFNFNVF